MAVTAPNQVWAMDITSILIDGAWLCLSGGRDRKVPSWRVSITMDVSVCIEALEDALARHRTPTIFNTAQGSQFIGEAFTGLLENRRDSTY